MFWLPSPHFYSPSNYHLSNTGILCSYSLLKAISVVISDHLNWLNALYTVLMIFLVFIPNTFMVQGSVSLKYWKNLSGEISDPLYCPLGHWHRQLLTLVKLSSLVTSSNLIVSLTSSYRLTNLFLQYFRMPLNRNKSSWNWISTSQWFLFFIFEHVWSISVIFP